MFVFDLLQHVFDYCVENRLQMSLHCTFLVHYLEKYGSEYAAHVIQQ